MDKRAVIGHTSIKNRLLNDFKQINGKIDKSSYYNVIVLNIKLIIFFVIFKSSPSYCLYRYRKRSSGKFRQSHEIRENLDFEGKIHITSG